MLSKYFQKEADYLGIEILEVRESKYSQISDFFGTFDETNKKKKAFTVLTA